MKKTLKEHYLSTLEEADEKQMFDNNAFKEWFNDWFKDQPEVYEIERDEHRWYYWVNVVRQVTIDYEVRFFHDQYQTATGDTYLEQEDAWLDPEECTEMYPVEVMTKSYRTTPQENL